MLLVVERFSDSFPALFFGGFSFAVSSRSQNADLSVSWEDKRRRKKGGN